jgi:hypothetical protein
MLILDKRTMRKRRRRLRWLQFKDKIKQYITNQRAKKITEQLRKVYVKTGDTVQLIAQHDYRFDLVAPLDVLCLQGNISYEYDDAVADRIYYITIKEKQND